MHFSFDTLLGLISVILGVVALIVGGKAYYDCRKLKTTFKDKKKFKDDSQDNSQQAGGDIINYTCDINALATITNANFETALTKANEMFAAQNKANLQVIIEKTTKLIQDNRINLAGMTKIDWINVYFENAKNTSDSFMQDVWARVLAKELAHPGSFSYKTLDVLKNMSEGEFGLFQKMCSIQFEECILHGGLPSKPVIPWIDLLQLGDIGLINLNVSKINISLVPGRRLMFSLCNDTLILIVKNNSETTENASYSGYRLTRAAIELIKIASAEFKEEYYFEVARYLKTKFGSRLTTTLHRVTYMDDAGYSYDENDLLTEQ